jgi:hypothetical protein
MSEFRVNSITNQDGSAGPQVCGVSTFSGKSGVQIPSGPTDFRRLDGGGRGRGIFFGGDPADPGNMTSVEIATTGNGSDFGNLANNLGNCKGCASSTRGLIMGGGTPSVQSGIQAVTISSAGGVPPPMINPRVDDAHALQFPKLFARLPKSDPFPVVAISTEVILPGSAGSPPKNIPLPLPPPSSLRKSVGPLGI